MADSSPEILVSKKSVILDATMLSTLMSCPRLLDLRFNHSLMALDGKSNSLEVGSIVHKVLETAYLQIAQGFPRTTAIGNAMTVGQLYIQGCPDCMGVMEGEPKCGHKPNEYPGVQNTPIENESKPKRTGWKWALETCEQYFEFYKNDSWIPLEVEATKREVLYEDDDIRVMWKAKLDLTVDTNQGIYPVDHKTAAQNRDSISNNNQFIGQCLLMNTRSMIVNKIGLQTTLKPEDKFKREVMPYTADRLLEWQSEILPYYAHQMLLYHEAGYYPPNFTHCENKYGKCQFYKDVCVADRGMREEELRNNFQVVEKWDV